MGNLLDRALAVYAEADLDRQLKARFFLVLSLVLLGVIFTLTVVDGLVQYLTVKTVFSSIIIPLIVSFFCVLSVLLLLIRGYFFLSAHLLVIIIMATTWIIMMIDPSEPLARLDSFIYIVSIMGIFPLVTNERRSIIFIYGLVNICLLFTFIYFCRPDLGVPDYDIYDYLFDTTLAMIAACFIAASVFAINQAAIKRAKAEIEERKQAEEKRAKLEAQLYQAQKMEAIGQLAGGVAHDFNNMLSVVIGNTDLIMMQQELDDEAQEQLTTIRYAVTRSAALIRQLLAFARKQTVVPEPLDINQTVSDMMPMLHQLLGENINLEWIPGKNINPIMMDSSQMDQILTNLLINARDAISDVGHIVIETRIITLGHALGFGEDKITPGPYAQLSVSDNGCGMSKEVRDQIFEPFFSTKKGMGTGLGLATIYGIVKQNNGHIEVYSEPGRGTTVKIYFPVIENQDFTVITKTDPPPVPDKGTETILMAEDNQEILRFAKTALERLGYTMLTVDTPEKALELVQSGEHQIDLLLTDVVMPHMNGQELAERIREIIPGIKCLYISGYTANALNNEDLVGEGIGFLAKPFSIKELAEKVRRSLDDIS